MNIVVTPTLYCGLHNDFQFLKPIKYYDEWVSYMTDLEYHWDQLEKSVGTLEETMNTLNLELNELRKKKKLLKLKLENGNPQQQKNEDPFALSKLKYINFHMSEIEKIIQNCELTKSIVGNELASKDLPLTSKEAKDGYDPKFNPKDRRLIQENWKNKIAKRFGKRGEKRTTKMEAKLERMNLGTPEFNESRNKKKNVKNLKKMLFNKGKKDSGIRKGKAANNKVDY
jgi:FtsZ-binding cell division protein ZapB